MYCSDQQIHLILFLSF